MRHVPLAAKAASPSFASGIFEVSKSDQVLPPSFVWIKTNLRSTGSDMATQFFLSQQAIASKKAFSLVFLNCNTHVLPPSFVLYIRELSPLPMLSM